MQFTDRRDFLYDPAIFHLKKSSATAARIHAEWVTKHSPSPYPIFMEVDRDNSQMDPLWHIPVKSRTQFSRELSIPVIFKSEKPRHRITKAGAVPTQTHQMIMSHNILQKFNYFPVRGDLVYFNGYRNMITNVVMDPAGYWQQTNFWLGLYVETRIPPSGDAKPVVNPGQVEPSEAGFFFANPNLPVPLPS